MPLKYLFPGSFRNLRYQKIHLIDLLNLQAPYVGGKNTAFYLCPAERGLGFSFQLCMKFGGATNTLPLACSYYYYAAFYTQAPTPPTPPSTPSNPPPHKTGEVKHPVDKVVQVCFASANNALFDTDLNPPVNGAHGGGLNLLFVEGHSEFAKWKQLSPCINNTDRPYNYDNSPLYAAELNK